MKPCPHPPQHTAWTDPARSCLPCLADRLDALAQRVVELEAEVKRLKAREGWVDPRLLQQDHQ